MKKQLFKTGKAQSRLAEPTKEKRIDFVIDANKVLKKSSKLILGGVAVTGLLVGGLMAANNFFNNYYFEFRTPIIFQGPVLIHERTAEMVSPLPEVLDIEVEAKEVEPTPTPDPRMSFVNDGETISESAIASIGENKWILNRVYRLESSAGKNDGCKYQGKFNGFGYRQNSFEHICFDTFEEVVGYVDAWFDKQLEEKTLDQALCYYNEGKLKDSCEYSIKFRNL